MIRPSLSARRAWIEILICFGSFGRAFVALRKESVDRNNTESANIRACIVALRKESVDRNNNKKKGIKDAQVALRKESVDRNFCAASAATFAFSSLSARRAWIEISTTRRLTNRMEVALRKESVDRNADAMLNA